MGQQQLLLLILSAVIVGVAIVMGINMFSENAVQANQDAVLQDVLTLATRAQAWFRRPAALGGGGRSFSGVDPVVDLNFDTSNNNGTYTIDGSAGTSATIVGTGNEDGDGDGSPFTITLTVAADSVTSTVVAD